MPGAVGSQVILGRLKNHASRQGRNDKRKR